MNKKAADESASNNGRATKIIHVQIDKMIINFVASSCSDKPNCAIVRISLWEALAIDDSNLIYEVFVKTEKREQVSAYLYGQVLGPLWADGTILHKHSGIAIQFVSPVKLRMCISHAFNKMLLEHVSHFDKLGMDFKEETEGDMLTTMDSNGASSTLTATWTTVETAYIAGVAQWWKEPTL